MNFSLKTFLIVAVSLALFASLTTFGLTAGSSNLGLNRPSTEINAPQYDDFRDILLIITNALLYIIASVALLAIVWGGITYVTSVGDEKKIERAKQIITYAVLGLVIAIVAYVIVHFIVGEINWGGSSAPEEPPTD